jgi:hypothetical protein
MIDLSASDSLAHQLDLQERVGLSAIVSFDWPL